MLEILGILMLCNKNKANALARGRKPGGFVGATIALWFGLELIGFLIGLAAGLETLIAYVPGLVCAIIGGVISYLVAKNCKPGSYVPPVNAISENIARYAQPLATPARIDIIRESSMVGAVVSWSFVLNGQSVGSLGNGKAMTAFTNQRQNILRATDAYGTEIAPYVFDMENGSYAAIHFKANKFLPEHSSGILPPTIPQSAQPQSVPPQTAAFCRTCGAPLAEDVTFCIKCGTRRVSVPEPADAPIFATPASPYPYVPYSPSAVPATPDVPAPNPMRAVYAAAVVSGVWLIILLLHFALPRVLYNSSLAGPLICLLLGAGAYLLMQRGLKYKLFGAGILLIEALIVTINSAVTIVSNLYGALDRLFDYFVVWPNLAFSLFGAAVIAGLSLLFSHIWRGAPEKKRIYGTGWIAAAGMLLFYVILTVINYTPLLSSGQARPEYMWLSIFGDILSALATGLSVMLLSGLCRQRKGRMHLSAWAIVWCVLCTIGMISTCIAFAAAEYTILWLIALTLGALTGYILLLCGRRTGFFVVLIAISAFLLGMFETGLQNALFGYNEYAGWLFSPLGALNPLITWFSIKSAWQGSELSPATGAPLWPQQKTVKTFSKVATIIILVIGSLFFLLPFPFMITEGFVDGMLACLLPGLVLMVFSILATVSLFGKNTRYHAWLDVLMQVLFWVICGVLVVGTVIGVLAAVFRF